MSIPQTTGTTNQIPLLVHEGPQQISDSLQLASVELSQKVELLEKDVATASKILAKKTAALEKFKKSRVLYEKNIQNALNTSETAIIKYYERRVTQKIDERKETLITITMDKMPTLLALPFINKYERSKEYSAEVGEVFKRVLEEIRQEILKEFTTLPGFVAYKDAYEENRNKLLQEAEAFNELKGLASINPQFPVSFVNFVHGMLIPEAEVEPGGFWNLIWDILAFGLFHPFINSRARATAIVDKYLDNSKKRTFNQLWKCMHQENPPGPMKALKSSLTDFKNCFNEAETIVRRNLDGAKSLLDGVTIRADVVPTYKQLSAELLQLKDECGKLEARVREDFPSS